MAGFKERAAIQAHIEQVEAERLRRPVNEDALKSAVSAVEADIQMLKRHPLRDYRRFGPLTDWVETIAFWGGVGLVIYGFVVLSGWSIALGVLGWFVPVWLELIDPKKRVSDEINSLIKPMEQLVKNADWTSFRARAGAHEHELKSAGTTSQRSEYGRYLESADWREKRKLALERAGHRCQVCSSKGHLQVHHRTYENIFDEEEDDLTVLCDDCHELFHSHGRLAGR